MLNLLAFIGNYVSPVTTTTTPPPTTPPPTTTIAPTTTPPPTTTTAPTTTWYCTTILGGRYTSSTDVSEACVVACSTSGYPGNVPC
jgi:hypothetical protein